ncbi:MAG: tRNA pseudouridine(55) synthase TruB [Actinobacteria bacterium]|uniref:tRNA pseudouridine(55) synthase n=1 Tax=freshwater metagenome TaxID=449393 RepID=A0A6J6VS02_9ZZZZ|nr:tRNA pseudouridine(55) synthase TruB [Actinomycetota bacterium]
MSRTSGVVLVDKPAGWTSHDVVAKMRGILRQRRIGHAGTLDPMATGLLVIAVGPATRLLRFATDTQKTYTGTVKLGEATDSLDADGVVIATAPIPDLSPLEAQVIAATFLGPQQQIPPMVSAIKVDGKKLYELAREGKEVVRKPRDIVVSKFAIAESEVPGSWAFEVTVTPGTYVRVLLADWAVQAGTLGHLTALRRTASGASLVDAAHTIESLQEAVAQGESVLAAPLEMTKQFPVVVVDDATVLAIRQGKTVAFDTPLDGDYLNAVDGTGELVAILRPKDDRWQPDVVLAIESTVKDS